MTQVTARVGPYVVGDGQPLLLVAGPCVLSDAEEATAIALQLCDLTRSLPVNLVFKGSFDKANRTSIESFRGPGLERGLEILCEVRRRTGLPVTTDVHERGQAGAVGAVCDLIQIPAFLSRQTDLLLAAGETGRAVHVKKGQFMAPYDMQHVIAKLKSVGCEDILVCERGTFFGYGRLVNDFTALPLMRQLGVPIVFDATHSVQYPGGMGGQTGGNREMVEPLARAAVAVGVDGLFLETHPAPERSPSDGPNMVRLRDLPGLLTRLLKIRSALGGGV